jgi:glycosyltransferase involved in cell wall biosynthesis
MRVLLDHQIMDAQVRGGISRYFHALSGAMQRKQLAEVRFPPIYTDNEYFKPADRPAAKEPGTDQRASKLLSRTLRKAKSRLNEWASVRELEKQGFDVFHPTYYDPYFLDHLKRKPFVLTICDMIHEIYPEHFSPRDRTRERKAILARAATRIIAPSETTRADVVRYLDIDSAKIDVIHLANSLGGESEAVPVPESYLLYVGGRGRRYKNFANFFGAFARLAAAFPALHLVCVGERGFAPQELAAIRGHGLESRCRSVPATDRQLAFLYRRAAVFVYPSLYEGFGLPILEAFASNCPVALSDASCFPEIAGDAALYFDPSDVRSIERTLGTVLSDDALRRALIERGEERLKGFSWAATAEQTAAAYARCLSA